MITGPESLADVQAVTDRFLTVLPLAVEESFPDPKIGISPKELIQEDIRQHRWNLMQAEEYLKNHSAFSPVLERELCQMKAEQKGTFMSRLFGFSRLGFPHGEELGEFLAGLAYDYTIAGSYRPQLKFSGWFSYKDHVEGVVNGFCEAAQHPFLDTEILLGREGSKTAVDYYRYHREDNWNDPSNYHFSEAYRENRGVIIFAEAIARQFASKGIAQFFPQGSIQRADLGRFIRSTVYEITLTPPKRLLTAEELAGLGITDTRTRYDRSYKPLMWMWNYGLWPVGPVRSRETGQIDRFAVHYSER